MPNTFSELIGQKQAVELLSQAVEKNRIAPAYLFTGPDGVGRSLAAQCFIELLFSDEIEDKNQGIINENSALKNRIVQRNHPDLLWVEPTYLHQGKRISAAEAIAAGVKRKAPPQIRLEQIREITQFLSRPPMQASRSVVVLEQAESMNESAANGLLKTLEEPGKATLILLAPGAESLLPTLVSRCQRIPFYRLNKTAISTVLKNIGHEEILQNKAVMALSQGSPGEAIASWQQLQTIPSDLLESVSKPPKNLREALEFAKEIDKNLDTEGQLWLLDYLQYCYWQQFWKKGGYDASLISLEKAKKYLLSYVQPRLVWECTLMGLCQGLKTGKA